jgi:hypothetical protein
MATAFTKFASQSPTTTEIKATVFTLAISDAAARSGSGQVRRRVRRHVSRNPIRALAPPEDDAEPVRPAFTDGWVRLDAQEFDVNNAAEAAVVAARFYDWTAILELPTRVHRMPGGFGVIALRLAEALRVRVERRWLS